MKYHDSVVEWSIFLTKRVVGLGGLDGKDARDGLKLKGLLDSIARSRIWKEVARRWRIEVDDV